MLIFALVFVNLVLHILVSGSFSNLKESVIFVDCLGVNCSDILPIVATGGPGQYVFLSPGWHLPDGLLLHLCQISVRYPPTPYCLLLPRKSAVDQNHRETTTKICMPAGDSQSAADMGSTCPDELHLLSSLLTYLG